MLQIKCNISFTTHSRIHVHVTSAKEHFIAVQPNSCDQLLTQLYISDDKPGGGGGGGGAALLGIFGRGVPPGSPNPDPISDQNIPFSTPVFRPLLYRK